MSTVIEMNKIASEIIEILAKHKIPIYMISEVFKHTRESVDSQIVEDPYKPKETEADQ